MTAKKMKSMSIIRATEGDALSFRGRVSFKGPHRILEGLGLGVRVQGLGFRVRD